MISILGGRGKYLFASREMDVCDYIPKGFLRRNNKRTSKMDGRARNGKSLEFFDLLEIQLCRIGAYDDRFFEHSVADCR